MHNIMNHHHGQPHVMPPGMELIEMMVLAAATIAAVLYIAAAVRAGKRSKSWPLYRTVLWLAGVSIAAAVLTGPLAERAHGDFTTHMLGHLLLGMAAPLLLALAAPMTLLLRTLPVKRARQLSRLLKSRIAQFYTHPLTAATLNIGGLAVLYTTPLFEWMHTSVWLYALVHLHVFAAGYLFTISLIYIDPISHRVSFMTRAVVLILALGFHKVLSKWIYAHPPGGVPRMDAESGALLMYYGGDLVDGALIVILCWQWYKASRPRAHEMAVLQRS